MVRSQKGFTIIELVVVIVILGILAATAFPRFADLSAGAHTAVVNGGIAALRSSAVIQFARNQGVRSSGASIVAQTDLDGGISASASGCDITVTSGTTSLSFTISADYCV